MFAVLRAFPRSLHSNALQRVSERDCLVGADQGKACRTHFVHSPLPLRLLSLSGLPGRVGACAQLVQLVLWSPDAVKHIIKQRVMNRTVS